MLRADFYPHERNRMMYVTYKFAGFRELSRAGGVALLENDVSHIRPFPDYVESEAAD